MAMHCRTAAASCSGSAAVRCLPVLVLSILLSLAGCAGGDNSGSGPPSNNNPECTSDAECTGDQICSDDGFCVEGTCERDADCEEGQVCLENGGYCVVPECTTNADCAAQQYCDTDVSKCLSGCSDNSDCADDELCNPNTNQCEGNPECTSNDECEDRQICRQEKCVSVQCVEDGDCSAGQTCNTQTNTCERLEGFCDGDEDCEQNQKCDLETNECVDTSCPECPEGTTCNEAAGQCWECERDSDCGDDAECNLTDHTCVESRCTSDNDCPDGELCNRINGQCFPREACVADSFEPNNSTGAARNLGEGMFTGLSVCADDEDWFSIDLNAGDTLTVTTTFTTALGNLDLELFDPNDARIGAATSNSDDEMIQAGDLALAGTYKIRVFPAEAGMENNYDLEIAIEENNNNDCTDDGFEPNNAAGTASPVIPQTYNNLATCAGDPDWYKIRVNPGQQLTATATFRHSDGDLDLVIYGPNGTTILDESRSADDDEMATTGTVTNAGDYYVVILGATPAIENTYELQIERTDGPDPCDDDGFEPNDTSTEARPTNPGLIDNLTVCPGNEDWYAVSLNAGDDINVSVGFNHADGDLELAIYDPNDAATPVAQSRTQTDDEVAGVSDVPVSGLYRIRVFGADANQMNTYNLQITRTEAPSDCTDDGFEDNDNIANAVDPGATMFTGQICSGDEDWFSFNVDATGDILVSIDFTNADGDLDLELFGPNDQSIGVSASRTADSELVGAFDVAMSGTYKARVSGFSGAENSYAVEVDIEAAACSDDQYEQNDSIDNPASVGFGSLTGLQICTGDEDWFAVDLSIGEGLDVDVTFTDADGDLDAFIWTPSGSIAAFGTSVTDNENISVSNVQEAGTYVIQVEGFSGAQNSYDLDLTLVEAPDPCDDDTFEQNDSMAAASAIDEGIFDTLSLCPQDPDFFAVELLEGETLDVLVEFTHADGNIDVQILDDAGFIVASGGSTTDDEVVTFRAVADGTHFIRVFGAGGMVENLYDLTVTIVPGNVCLEDFAEENDTAETAELLTPPFLPAVLPDLGLCQDAGSGEEDWFTIELFEGESLILDIFFDHDLGDIDLELYDTDGTTLIDFSYSSTDDQETVAVILASAGTYYIRVFSFFTNTDINSNYDMLIDIF